jgi:hypothetical protein
MFGYLEQKLLGWLQKLFFFILNDDRDYFGLSEWRSGQFDVRN